MTGTWEKKTGKKERKKERKKEKDDKKPQYNKHQHS